MSNPRKSAYYDVRVDLFYQHRFTIVPLLYGLWTCLSECGTTFFTPHEDRLSVLKSMILRDHFGIVSQDKSFIPTKFREITTRIARRSETRLFIPTNKGPIPKTFKAPSSI